MPYVRSETGATGHVQHLEKQVLLVVETYIESMFGSVESVLLSDGALENPLDDYGSLKEQLDRLPVICRFQYGPVANMILAKLAREGCQASRTRAYRGGIGDLPRHTNSLMKMMNM